VVGLGDATAVLYAGSTGVVSAVGSQGDGSGGAGEQNGGRGDGREAGKAHEDSS
jgi:hypothetical protein